MDDSVCPARFTGFAGVFSSWSWLLTYLERFFLVREPFTPLLIPLAELAVAAIIRNFLINFLGDVAIYTNLNQRSANFAMRAQILEECGHALTLLYQDLRKEAGENFEIVIAAHSLGTVIAYDTLNDLFNRARIHAAAVGAKQPLQPGGQSCPSALAICQHMRGMLTFGSPLNKTYYFFRDQSPAESLVRSQIVDQLHSFRLLESAQPQPSMPLQPVQPVDPGDDLPKLIRRFRWLNAWAHMDIFSGKLFFYDLPTQDQRRMPYRVPVMAHTRYWTDQEIYKWFATQLLR